MEQLIAGIPDVLYIPRLRMDPPLKWLETHPEEVCVFEGTSTDLQDIVELVRQGKVNKTFNMDDEPMATGMLPMRCDEPIGMQSFSSKVWVKDACVALEKAVEHFMPMKGIADMIRLIECWRALMWIIFPPPKPYSEPQPGGYGGSSVPVASIMRRKVWVEELDNRTHLTWEPIEYPEGINVRATDNLEETANVYWREVCKLEQDNVNWWWMDQGDPQHRWYDSDELMEVFADQVKVHHYRTVDLSELDITDYKLIFLRNPQRLTKESVEDIHKRMACGGRIFFCDLPAVCAGEFSLERVYEITGMHVKPVRTKDGKRIEFVIDDGMDEIIHFL